MAFDELAYKAGAIPHKYKELMAVAVAAPRRSARIASRFTPRMRGKAGASEQELAEDNASGGSRCGRVGAMTHGTQTLE